MVFSWDVRKMSKWYLNSDTDSHKSKDFLLIHINFVNCIVLCLYMLLYMYKVYK